MADFVYRACTLLTHAIFIFFAFAFGSCVGSFLNVVVWRLPQMEDLADETTWKFLRRCIRTLSYPPSRCPKCEHPLAWYDNIPVFGWLKLGGKCRYCKVPISMRYPIVEASTGLLFVFYYVMFFIAQVGPCADPMRDLMPQQDLPIYVLYMVLLAALLAASLIDAELYLIPPIIPWSAGLVGIVAHALIDLPGQPGNLLFSPGVTALSIGASLGVILSVFLLSKRILPLSFPLGEPYLEIDLENFEIEKENAKRENRKAQIPEVLPPKYSRWQITVEMCKEMLFLTPPLILAALFFLASQHDWVQGWWARVCTSHMLRGACGAMLGGLIGGFVIWFVRIAGTIGFGRVAMGRGDTDLMFAIGAVLGPGPAIVTFFLAPFPGLLFGLYKLIVRAKRELPYGPYLCFAAAATMLLYCPIANHFGLGFAGLYGIIRMKLGLAPAG